MRALGVEGDHVGVLADGSRAITAFHLPHEAIYPVAARIAGLAHRAVVGSVVRRFHRGASGSADLVAAMAENALVRLGRTEAHVVSLARRSPTGRVAAFLLDPFARRRMREPDASVLSLCMGRADVADHLGLQPGTVSRVLKRLDRDGCIPADGLARHFDTQRAPARRPARALSDRWGRGLAPASGTAQVVAAPRRRWAA